MTLCVLVLSMQGLYLSGVIGDRVNLRYVLCIGLCGSAAVVSTQMDLVFGCVCDLDRVLFF